MTISACPVSPSRGFLQTRPMDRFLLNRPVKLRRGLFLVVDAKTGVSGEWIIPLKVQAELN